MISAKVFDFYNETNKLVCARIFDGLQHSLKEDSLNFKNVLQYTIQLTLERNVLSYFHYKLLRLLLSKYQCEATKAEDLTNMVKVLLKSAKNVSFCDSTVVQREYLKIVCFVVKNQVILIDKETVDPFLIWFNENSWMLLEKYFLKIFNCMTLQELLDASSYSFLLSSLDMKGYRCILLKDEKDFFIDILFSKPTPQIQLQAFELVLNLLFSLICRKKYKLVIQFYDSYVRTSVSNIKLLRGYIKSIMLEDDILHLSNLHIGAKIYQVLVYLQPRMNENDLNKLIELFDIYYWFHHFVVHIQYDHQLVIDWLLDGVDICQSYLLEVLPVISANFEQFVQNLPELCNGKAVVQDVMDFLIKLNLRVHDVNNDISKILDEIESKYECFGDIPDPLSAILSSDFLSQCSVDSKGSEPQGNDDHSGLVAYSDSD